MYCIIWKYHWELLITHAFILTISRFSYNAKTNKWWGQIYKTVNFMPKLRILKSYLIFWVVTMAFNNLEKAVWHGSDQVQQSVIGYMFPSFQNCILKFFSIWKMSHIMINCSSMIPHRFSVRLESAEWKNHGRRAILFC